MSVDRLVLFGEYPTEIEAEVIRGILERGGVRAFLSNSASATALSYVGTAVGGAKIQVLEKDLSLAQQLLEQETEVAPDSSAWQCSNCYEEQDAGFDVCWKCGQDRPSPATPFSAADPASPLASPASPLASKVGRTKPAESQELNRDDAVDRDIEQAEKDVVRAWRAAIYGVVLFPFLLHLFSAFLLISVALGGNHLSRATRRLFWGAAAIDLIIFFLVYSILKFGL